MLRVKVIAFILAIAVICSIPVFSASAANETCAVSVEIVGSGAVSVNGTSTQSSFSNSFEQGTSVTMVATPDEDFEFLFWVNAVTRKIVSWNSTYTFTVSTQSEFEAVFDVSESVAAEDDCHTVVYLTQGENIICMEYVEMDDTSFFAEVGTHGMAVSGKVWIGWDKTADVVAATPGRVFVRPLYNTEATFTVTWTVNGTTQSMVKQYLSRMTLTAPTTQDGESFSYWVAKAKDVNAVDEIASFYASYNFVVTGNVTLEAVYGQTVEQGIASRIAGDFPSFNESSITIAAEHSVTNEYTVTQHGMLITKDMHIGSFDDAFVINPNESKIIKFTSSDTTRYGNYRINLSGWNAENMGTYTAFPRIYARAYVIAKDRSGVMHTFYGARYCVDYVFETGEGGWDNHDDPFGNP